METAGRYTERTSAFKAGVVTTLTTVTISEWMEKLLIRVKVAGLMEGRLLHGAVMFAVCDRQERT